jgi:N-acetylglucosaminyldiphosphoundecaprenol N-acetyl-beta-D-mannosaminyltransferase
MLVKDAIVRHDQPIAPLWGFQVYTGTRSDLVRSLLSHVSSGLCASVLSLNTLKLQLAGGNDELGQVFHSFDYVTADGQSIVMAVKLLEGITMEHASGVELMIDLIRAANDRKLRVFFLGSEQALLDKVKGTMEVKYPSAECAYQHGYYSTDQEESVVESIASFGPDLLFVAFGSPRKELFIHKFKQRLNAKVMMGVGGSYEVLVGDKKIDPLTKRLGLRWLARTVQDPIRLLPRYIKCNSYFLWLMLKELPRILRRSKALHPPQA